MTAYHKKCIVSHNQGHRYIYVYAKQKQMFDRTVLTLTIFNIL